MKAAVVVALGLAAGSARAEMVEEPPPVGGCTSSATWQGIATCLAHAGWTPKTLRDERDLQLVQLVETPPQPGHPRIARPTGLALYVRRGGGWQLGGHYEAPTDQWELLDFQAITINRHGGYKLAIGQAMPATVVVEMATVPALARQIHELYCSTTTFYCTDIHATCEVLVRGRAWFAFHGTVRRVENDVQIVGDRTKSGSTCSIAERVSLGW